MSDEVAPASEQDQPIDAPEAPETDQPSGEESFTDFDTSQIPEDADREWLAQRYQQMQADYTRKTQGVSEARREAENAAQSNQIVEALRSKNPQVAVAILGQLGYDPEEVLGMYGYSLEDGEDEFVDPDEQFQNEFQQFRQEWEFEKEARQRQENEQAVEQYIGSEIKSLEAELGYELSKEEREGLDAYSRAFPKEEAGRLIPDVKGAHEFLSGIVKAGNKRLIAGKENAPRKPGGGSAGSRTVDLSKETPDQRRERMMNAVGRADAG